MNLKVVSQCQLHCNMCFRVLSYVVMQQWSLPRYWDFSPAITSNQILPEG